MTCVSTLAIWMAKIQTTSRPPSWPRLGRGYVRPDGRGALQHGTNIHVASRPSNITHTHVCVRVHACEHICVWVLYSHPPCLMWGSVKYNTVTRYTKDIVFESQHPLEMSLGGGGSCKADCRAAGYRIGLHNE
jgi:hypothetical protein